MDICLTAKVKWRMPDSLGNVQVGVWGAWEARLGLGELDPFLERMKDMTSHWTSLMQYLVPSEYFHCMPHCSGITCYMLLLSFLPYSHNWQYVQTVCCMSVSGPTLFHVSALLLLLTLFLLCQC